MTQHPASFKWPSAGARQLTVTKDLHQRPVPATAPLAALPQRRPGRRRARPAWLPAAPAAAPGRPPCVPWGCCWWRRLPRPLPDRCRTLGRAGAAVWQGRQQAGRQQGQQPQQPQAGRCRLPGAPQPMLRASRPSSRSEQCGSHSSAWMPVPPRCSPRLCCCRRRWRRGGLPVPAAAASRGLPGCMRPPAQHGRAYAVSMQQAG